MFLEELAVKDGGLIVPKNVSVNKIGHGLHLVSPVFRSITYSKKFKAILDKLQFKDPRVLQSMFIFKVNFI